MKVIVVAGGTGGHIYPAIAIINKIKEKEKKVEFLYIGTSDRMEKDIIPNLGIKFVGIDMEGQFKLLKYVDAIKDDETKMKSVRRIITEALTPRSPFNPFGELLNRGFFK